MAHSLSAKKRARQNVKQRLRNRMNKSDVKTQMKKFEEIVKQSSDTDVIEKEYRLTQKKIDQLTAKGVLPKNTAARKKAQLARLFKTAQTKAG